MRSIDSWQAMLMAALLLLLPASFATLELDARALSQAHCEAGQPTHGSERAPPAHNRITGEDETKDDLDDGDDSETDRGSASHLLITAPLLHARLWARSSPYGVRLALRDHSPRGPPRSCL